VHLLVLLLVPTLAQSQTRTEHPLQELTAQEYWTAHEVLQVSGKVDPDTMVMSVLLHEPAKDKVLAWKPGDPIMREVDVILMRKGVVTEVRVDLVQHKVESWKAVTGVQAPIFLEELLVMGELAKNDPRMQA
jgi:primary-amine oxidase